MTGTCFDIKRYAIHDGPGIRTTVFLKGCPLDCPWCHNPEGKSREREILLIPDRCIECGACLEVCPTSSIVRKGDTIETQTRLCTQCGQCVEVCPSEARRHIGWEISVPELMNRILRDRPFFEESNGGVTFSGGEPFYQPEFLLACLASCREHGLHTAVDTSGFVAKSVLMDSAPLIDLYLFDLKTANDECHRSWTGVSVIPILENLRILDEMDNEVWIRIPLIPGLNDDAPALASLGEFLLSLKRKHPITILPYHMVGSDKARRLLGSMKSFRQFEHPSIETIRRMRDHLASLGLDLQF
ncbi:MAG: glycyl-radical enzyme activating protein [Candidatus Eisenbacteria bacterium]|uniref:Glycyl-radical enzyme activating protein n=1 Tax=Eiseniibacteriota bacterium TaxID=2212470 RepID=A0A948RVX8_UNCEI|nr:glycyl-radical enzyme activating protein [Candidatus Eisenbacteria bacterium]MBU1948733.1 glycyl-radical enzyme activating protein [Candidatus Eisenbacteria bacterium]MBU2690482.1 glycyl-radical enzyme activating protein [Candidatus Eisenbacteria bacterium]